MTDIEKLIAIEEIKLLKARNLRAMDEKRWDDYHAALKEWDGNIKTKPRLPIHPTVRWENTIDIKATKFLTTSLSFQLYYNRAQNSSIQTKTLLSVGLSYTFKNK